MTEGAGEITPAEKDQGGDPARKIEQTRPLETFDSHRISAFISFDPPHAPDIQRDP